MTGRGAKCEGSKLIPTWANGGPAAAIYNPAEDGYDPWAVVVLETSDGRITGLHHFIGAEQFAYFGLPPRLDAQGAVSPTSSSSPYISALAAQQIRRPGAGRRAAGAPARRSARGPAQAPGDPRPARSRRIDEEQGRRIAENAPIHLGPVR